MTAGRFITHLPAPPPRFYRGPMTDPDFRHKLSTALCLGAAMTDEELVHAARVATRASDAFGAELLHRGGHVVQALAALRDNPERPGLEIVAILRGISVEAAAPALGALPADAPPVREGPDLARLGEDVLGALTGKPPREGGGS